MSDMMRDITPEGLKEILDTMKDCCIYHLPGLSYKGRNNIEKACSQLRKIMEEHFSIDKYKAGYDQGRFDEKMDRVLADQGQGVEEEEEQPPMDKETAGDKKYHELKDEDRLDTFGRRK